MLFAARLCRRALSLSFFALAGAACSGDVENAAPDVAPAASGLWCATSFGCPGGERCEASACVSDVSCPSLEAPRLLHESAAGDAFFDCAGPMRSGDREYFEGCAQPGTIEFVDLRGGGTSALFTKRGGGSCGGEPTHCLLDGEDQQTLLLGVGRDDGPWSVEAVVSGLASFTLPDDADLRAGRVLQQQAESVGFVDLASGAYQPWVELEGRPAQNVIRNWQGDGRVVLTHSNVGVDATVFELAPLEQGGSFRMVLEQSPGFAALGVAIPTSDGWFIVADHGDASSSAVGVWHVTAETTVEVGDIDDAAIDSVTTHYHRGEPRLEDGHIGYALECDPQGDRCHTSRVDLAVPAVAPIGEARIEGAQGLTSYQYRSLACGAVEALVEEPLHAGGAVEPTGKRYWLMRVPGDATP